MRDMLSGAMRRSDRQITDFEGILDVLERCDTLRLGMNGEGYPYVVPVSFGYEALDGRVTLTLRGRDGSPESALESIAGALAVPGPTT